MSARSRVVLVVSACVLAEAVGLWIAAPSLSRVAKERLEADLKRRFGTDLEIHNLTLTLFPSVRVTAAGIVVHYQNRKDLPPLIRTGRLSCTTDLAGLFSGHTRRMEVERLQVEVPPENQRASGNKATERSSGEARTDWLVDEITADNASVVTLPDDPDNEPLEWDIKHLTLHGLGAANAASFQAYLTNAKPPGDIQTTGSFGPWSSESPGGTPVSGMYSFKNANLSVFSGIAGTLPSAGSYRGSLNRIAVDGQTDTPDFSVQVSANRVHLTTQFHAVVDGTDGDTQLDPVNVQFGRSSLTTRGSVEGQKGVTGKTVSLDATTAGARLQDMLYLAVKGEEPIMTGATSFRMRLVIPPGDIDIAQKLQLQGVFTADAAHFPNLDIQERVNKLSHKGSGHPKTPDTDSVASDFKGAFRANQGVITFQNLSFQVPGAKVLLNGRYSLVSEGMDFRGTLRLQAKLSQATTGFKSLLLKAVDPFFKKKDAGAVLPIRIDGTRDKPTFGLNFHGGHRSQP